MHQAFLLALETPNQIPLGTNHKHRRRTFSLFPSQKSQAAINADTFISQKIKIPKKDKGQSAERIEKKISSQSELACSRDPHSRDTTQRNMWKGHAPRGAPRKAKRDRA